jgi:hypothetical protein
VPELWTDLVGLVVAAALLTWQHRNFKDPVPA